VTSALFTPVAGVPAGAPKGGLLAAVPPSSDGDERWANGFVWRPETCFAAHGTQVCGSTVGASHGGVDGGLVYHRPVGFHVETVCSTRYNSPGDDEARARRQLVAATSYLLARELWTGELTQTDTYDTPTGDTGITNAYLANADANVVTGAFDPIEAIGLLEETARAAALGQDVHLHVPMVVMPFLAQHLTQQGPVLRTQTGGLVISDAGYLGTGPAGQAASATSVWMYATAPVQTRVSSIATMTIHNQLENSRLMVAERAGAATFDPCVHFAIAVTLPGSTP
jgi:hypothetical protein